VIFQFLFLYFLITDIVKTLGYIVLPFRTICAEQNGGFIGRCPTGLIGGLLCGFVSRNLRGCLSGCFSGFLACVLVESLDILVGGDVGERVGRPSEIFC